MTIALSRVFVVSTVMAAMATVIVASAVLGHGSGTYFATLIMLPILVVPGALVFWQPRARWFALWSATAFITSILYLLGADPYSYEQELQHWGVVEAAVWLTLTLVVGGALFGTFYLGARVHVAADLATPLARRLRRIVLLVVVIATPTALIGFLPGRRVFVGNTFLYERSAGGWILLVALVLLVLPGVLVYRDPRKRWAWLWIVWSVPALSLVFVSVVGIDVLSHSEYLSAGVFTRFTALMLIFLQLGLLPVIAIFTRVPPTTLPTAIATRTGATGSRRG